MSRQMYRLISISSLKQGSISCLLLGVVRECKSSLKMTLCYISLNFLYTIWGLFCIIFWSSVQFSHLVVSESLWPHGQQHARPPCPSPTPRAYSNSCPLHQWCHPTILSSVVPFSLCLQSLSASGSFPIRWPKYWSFSFSICPSKEYSGLISFGLTGSISLQSLLQHYSSKASILRHSVFFIDQLSHPNMTTGKTIALTRWTFVFK